MKTKLPFSKQNSFTFILFILLCLCFNFGWSQTNLVQNGTCQIHTSDTNDNADSWDMTPNSDIEENGADIPSPYRYDEDDNPNGWYNSALADWLETNCGDSDEQPGSSSDGNWDYSAGPDLGVKTRGVKISEACRRLYQKVVVTPGKEYTFSIESRSEAQFDNGGVMENVKSGVFILNEEITTEVGLENGANDPRVDAFFAITNDFNPSKSNATTDNFTKNTFTFTASGSFVIIYVRAPQAIDSSREVFYDNISLIESSSLSSNDFIASKLKIYPNPAEDLLYVQSNSLKIDSVEMFSMLGKKVLTEYNLNNSINISSLARGIYLLKVNTNNDSHIQKLIIE